MTGEQITAYLKQGNRAIQIAAPSGLVLKLGTSDQLAGEVLDFIFGTLMVARPNVTMGEVIDGLQMAHWWLVMLGATKESPSPLPMIVVGKVRLCRACMHRVDEHTDNGCAHSDCECHREMFAAEQDSVEG